ncbi:MAG TPA: hypothetical protein VMR49_02215 [Candidatus Paceibacterota bacterium]|jgi:hypothetical protein|nr:hypothetical protein [Candidatus Paceibacterota bacterium]
MKKILFFLATIIAIGATNLMAQKVSCMRIITVKDTIYIPMAEKPVADIVMHEIASPLDSLKKCLMSGKWYPFKAEKSSGPGANDWTEYPIPFAHTDYDLYSADSTWSYHANGSVYFQASYTMSTDGKQINQSLGAPLKIWTLTMDEFVWSYCDNNGCYRATQKHTMLP